MPLGIGGRLRPGSGSNGNRNKGAGADAHNVAARQIGHERDPTFAALA